MNIRFSGIGNTEVKSFNPEGKTQRQMETKRINISNGSGYQDITIGTVEMADGDGSILISVPEVAHFDGGGFAFEIETPGQ